jgi:trans-aconitate 2-methyltransferase
MTWDPKTYLAFAGERTRPAAELLARIPLEGPKQVADLGCGPGNSTALLAARWPSAAIAGVDPSESMLAEAEASSVHARWIKSDIAVWAPDRPCDVIFSNAAFQWLDQHETLLPRLMTQIADGGVFAFQVPRNFDAPSHALMREVANGGPWKSKLSRVRRMGVLTPERYFDLLSSRATRLDIWETEYLHVLDGDDPVFRWVSGTGLRPYADALLGEEREDFLAAYRAQLRLAYPRRPDGSTLFPFKRLFVVATT